MGAAMVAAPSLFANIKASAKDFRPNILLFFPDQHRYDWTGLNPDLPLRTPNLNQIAESGVHYSNAVCPSPLCAPSRACLASGKEYDRAGVINNGVNYPESQLTFYTMLRESGYHVMGCGKYDLRKPAMDWGRDGTHQVQGRNYLRMFGFSDGIDNSGKHDGINAYKSGAVCPYFDYLEQHELAGVHVSDFEQRPYPSFENTEPTPLAEHGYADNFIAQNGLDLIHRAPAGKPWFLQVNFNGPHEPMDVTERMKQRWEDVMFPQPVQNTQFSPEKHVEIRQNYAAMIENIDVWLGKYLDELEERGELENTLIVFSADHGEMLGDHNRWMKNVPYQPSVGVPLVISGPGVKSNEMIQSPTTTLDLTATFLDYAGISTPEFMDSRTLRPQLEGHSEASRKYVKSGLEEWRMVMNDRYKLIRGFDRHSKDRRVGQPGSLLFDMQKDPIESKNLAETKPEVVEDLSRLL
jgi:arylsulfatase A-like enzyme